MVRRTGKNCRVAVNWTTENMFVLSGLKSAALLKNGEIFTTLTLQGNKRLSSSNWSFLIITCCISILLNSVSTYFILNSCDWDHPTGRKETRGVRSPSSAFMKSFWMKFGIITWIVLQWGSTHSSISFLTISLENLGYQTKQINFSIIISGY